MVTNVSCGPASFRAWLNWLYGAAGFEPTPLVTNRCTCSRLNTRGNPYRYASAASSVTPSSAMPPRVAVLNGPRQTGGCTAGGSAGSGSGGSLSGLVVGDAVGVALGELQHVQDDCARNDEA